MRLGAAGVLLAALLIAGAAAAQSRGGEGRPGAPRAGRTAINGLDEPSEIVAADVALAHLARDKDLAQALRTTAAPEAQIFLPGQTGAPLPLRLAAWLKGKPALPPAPRWQTRDVWMSCDGSYAVSHGADYTTVWRRQKKGGYQWVLLDWQAHAASSAANAQGRDGEDWINGKVADCPARRRPLDDGNAGKKPARPEDVAPRDYPAPPPEFTSGHATDGSLVWEMLQPATGPHRFSLKLKLDGEMREVFAERP